MTGEELPEQHHITRYCKFTSLSEDGHPTGDSFLPRASDEALSVYCLEFSGHADRQSQLTQVRQETRLTLKRSAKFAVLNIGHMLCHVHSSESHDRTLTVKHKPENGEPAHSGVYGYTHEDDMVAELIAEVVEETHPAV